jgi:isopentenyl-diphosphate Delta-isomerase
VDQVILVDTNDNPIGSEEKIKAHELALLHRAFSVFVFNKKGELMLQRRALHKYHSPGLWTNTCCSHPRPGEETMDAAHRRLVEEMGFDCNLNGNFHSFTKPLSTMASPSMSLIMFFWHIRPRTGNQPR